MNFIFVSPQFPRTYWQFCDRLRRDGATVLGIGDTPYDQIDPRLKDSLAEYYWTPSLEDYDAVYRAVAFFCHKYGKVDWIESNNEYWLALDARLREDFNVTTGAHPALMADLQSKRKMKELYGLSGVPSARQIQVTSLDEARRFVHGHDGWPGVAFPVFVKPERGVGSGGTRKISDDAQLDAFFASSPAVPYVLEEYVTGDICSYDAILDSHGNPLFENQEEFPPSMAEVAARRLDMSYCSCPTVDPRLRELGRAAARGFGLKSRFVHMEFFRLTQDKPGLAARGDYVGLEVNVRPPGGYTPDMMNFAHDTDVYQIWADMVCFDERRLPPSPGGHWCVYASRRDMNRYRHSREDVLRAFGPHIRMSERMPAALSDDLGDTMFTAVFDNDEDRQAFVAYVQEREDDHE